jgi:hypothetical protein
LQGLAFLGIALAPTENDLAADMLHHGRNFDPQAPIEDYLQEIRKQRQAIALKSEIVTEPDMHIKVVHNQPATPGL